MGASDMIRAGLVVVLALGVSACASPKPPADAAADGASKPAAAADAKPGDAGAGSVGGSTPESRPIGGTTAGDTTAPTSRAALAARPARDQRSVFYEFDVYNIKDEYKALVEAHARYLSANPGVKLIVQGHADERGTREYNLALGQRRADGLRRAMVLLGAREGQVDTVSFGEEKPRAQGHDEPSWAQNRRGDLVYQDEQ
ncbi:MAG: peptidoglycan-associated lipoprotein Pal [Betaproteobacteria bacterium]|nr:peptidoglycan-associated lipoprotein Pal [Betaproteobacteria bacterium]